MALPSLLYAAANRFSTTLSGNILSTDLSIQLTSTAGLNSTGGVLILNKASTSREIIYYSSYSGNTLTIPSGGRGLGGTSAANHSSGESVNDVGIAEHINYLIASLIAEHTTTGAHYIQSGTPSSSSNKLIDKAYLDTVAKITASGHTQLVTAASKLSMIQALRQNDTTNTYNGNTVVLSGWGFKAGDGTNKFVNETVTFGVTFAAAPVVLISYLGYKASADPTLISDFTDGGGATAADSLIAVARNITTTTFVPRMFVSDNSTALPTANRYGYSWIAIGEVTV